MDALLKWHEEAGDFLESPAVDPEVTLDASGLTEAPGTVIGRYKLLERIGEGGMAVVYIAEQKRYEEAERLLIEAWEGRRKKLGEGHPDTLESLHDFGVMYLEQGRHDDAEATLLAAYEGRNSKLDPDHPMTLKSLNTLIQLYESWPKPEEAARWRTRLPRHEEDMPE